MTRVRTEFIAEIEDRQLRDESFSDTLHRLLEYGLRHDDDRGAPSRRDDRSDFRFEHLRPIPMALLDADFDSVARISTFYAPGPESESILLRLHPMAPLTYSVIGLSFRLVSGSFSPRILELRAAGGVCALPDGFRSGKGVELSRWPYPAVTPLRRRDIPALSRVPCVMYDGSLEATVVRDNFVGSFELYALVTTVEEGQRYAKIAGLP